MKTLIKIFVLFLPVLLNAQSVIDSPHDLSLQSQREYRSINESEVCIFCHTPHSANPEGPMWNKSDQGFLYTIYNSPTFQAISGQPDGSSILCLSCHDGTIALASLQNSKKNMDFTSQFIKGNSNLTRDLSDDHPVSFIYDAALAKTDGKLIIPDKTMVDVNGKMQCTSCHNPHDNSIPKFLTESFRYGAICKNCHDVSANWAASVHMTSDVSISGSSSRLHDPFPTIAENACSNCHRPHDAQSKPLLNAAEEHNCLNCHNGSIPAAANISADLLKSARHNVSAYSQVHKSKEDALPANQHVECSDCHNPHEIMNTGKTVQAPMVKGANMNVQGISISGSPVNQISFEYELCFRCHSQNAVTSSPTTRMINTVNTRLEFSTGNVSFHPVAGPRNNSEVTSLIPPLTSSSQIYCTDCHSGNGSGAAAGPHGSSFPYILKSYYNRSKSTTGFPQTLTASFLNTQYALCAECHNMNTIIKNHGNMNNGHFLKYTSCNTCHDPHGFEGGSTLHNNFLINFDIDVIKSDQKSDDFITFEGNGHGTCNFRCHDVSGGFVFKDHEHVNARF